MNKYFHIAHRAAKRIKYRKNKKLVARNILKNLILGLNEAGQNNE